MIPTEKSLDILEQKFGINFPPSYKTYLANYTDPFEFHAIYLRGRFISTIDEIKRIKKLTRIGESKLFPFFLDEQRSLEDFYCFDLSSPGPEYNVVVFAIHTLVYKWENFNNWLEWNRIKLQS